MNSVSELKSNNNIDVFDKYKLYDLPFISNKNNITFDHLTKKLLNKDIIHDTAQLLQKFYCDIKPRIFLCSLVIYWYPDIVLENATEEDKKLLLISSKLILQQFYKSINNKISTKYLVQSVLLYKKAYNKWIKKDKAILAIDLVNRYKDLHLTQELINKNMDKKYVNYWDNDIKTFKEKIKKKLLILGCEKEIQICDIYNKQNNIKFIDIDKIIKEVGSKQFWNNVQIELESMPINWDTTLSIITEIRDRFIKIFPKMKKTYYKLIDVPYINQMMNHNVFDNKELVILFSNIIECFIITQESNSDNELLKWKQQIITLFSMDNFIWTKEIPLLLNKLLVRLDILENHIKIINNIINYNKIN